MWCLSYLWQLMQLSGRQCRREEQAGVEPGDSSSRPARRRRLRREEPDPAIVDSLTTMLDGCNPLVETFRTANHMNWEYVSDTLMLF